jgi:hypothetical protein
VCKDGLLEYRSLIVRFSTNTQVHDPQQARSSRAMQCWEIYLLRTDHADCRTAICRRKRPPRWSSHAAWRDKVFETVLVATENHPCLSEQYRSWVGLYGRAWSSRRDSDDRNAPLVSRFGSTAAKAQPTPSCGHLLYHAMSCVLANVPGSLVLDLAARKMLRYSN